MREKRAAALLSTVSEKKWQDTVIAVAKAHGWMVYHTYDSRRSEPGFPDLILVHREKRRMVVFECKTVTGVVSADQEKWLRAFADVRSGPSVHIVRPGDLDEVNEALV